MYDICRFWLDRGSSGFRVSSVLLLSHGRIEVVLPLTSSSSFPQLDACQFLSKPVGYTDAPIVDPSQYLQPVVKHVAHGSFFLFSLFSKIPEPLGMKLTPNVFFLQALEYTST